MHNWVEHKIGFMGTCSGQGGIESFVATRECSGESIAKGKGEHHICDMSEPFSVEMLNVEMCIPHPY